MRRERHLRHHHPGETIMSNCYLATADTIGEWDNPEIIIKLWNDHIAPALETASDDGSGLYEQQRAWELFCVRVCGTGSEFDHATCAALSAEIRARLA
jgi:hypothetical protein